MPHWPRRAAPSSSTSNILSLRERLATGAARGMRFSIPVWRLTSLATAQGQSSTPKPRLRFTCRLSRLLPKRRARYLLCGVGRCSRGVGALAWVFAVLQSVFGLLQGEIGLKQGGEGLLQGVLLYSRACLACSRA